MQHVECAVIAAAGLGSRLGHGLPKCMLEIGGKTVLSRLVDGLKEHVSRIHVVVGYREELITSLCASMHRKIVIVRNPDYRSTNTAQSMALGAKGCSGKTIFLDGDLIIKPSTLHRFIFEAQQHPVLVAITRSHSEGPVNVVLRAGTGSTPIVESFTRETGKEFEWANVVAGPARMLDGATGYVYEALLNHAPLQACELELREVDTVADLERARAFASELDQSIQS